MGKPVLIGPHTYNFAEVSKNAIQAGAAILVNDVNELHEKIEYLQQNKAKQVKMRDAAMRYNQASIGATAKMMALIKPFLS